MGDFKIKPPAPLIRSTAAQTGTLGFKRHHIPHHPLHHHRLHNHDETGQSRTKLEQQQQVMDDPRQAGEGSLTSTLSTSRKGSLAGSPAANLERERRISIAQQVEVSTAVRNLQITGEQQMLRLAHTYASVSQKLNEIRLMGEQLKALGKAAEEILKEFDAGDLGTRREYAAQIKGIERFQEELVSIQKLQERLEAEKRKVMAYRERLERVQGRIDKQKEMEMVWRQRASRRLRLLWGFISILVILWLLATASNDAEQASGSTSVQVVQAVQVDHSSSPPTLQYTGKSREL